MSDVITKIGSSVLQHGKFNDRIYLMKLSGDNPDTTISELERLALTENYSKIIAKVPGSAKALFENAGYLVEAYIPGFFKGYEDAYFMGKYFSESRLQVNKEEIKEVLNTAILKSDDDNKVALPEELSYKLCDVSDIPQIVDIFKNVFETYPFPIHEHEYIEQTMDENVSYFSARENDRIVALASSEMDFPSQSVEMTDFATLPEYRGEGVAIYLLQKMEQEMKKRDIKTAYTIARAGSYGINIIFARSGYKYSGTLLKNTHISGNLESMNIWHKRLH